MCGQGHARLLPRLFSIVLGLGAVSAWAAITAPPLWAESTIAIEATWVDPPVLRAVVGERVTIVNRTGQMVHVEFPGDVRSHLVVQIPGIAPIRVTFRRPGTHPYVVHFPGTPRAALEGKVEVVGDPREGSDLQSCAELTSTGVCLER
jgi:hypothetical protein